MNGVKTTDLDLVGGAVAAFLAESDKSAFAAGLQRLIDTDALALVSEHCLLDIPLFWVVRGGRPPVELAERFLGFLFRHQDRHLWSGAGEKLLRHFLIRVFGCDPNSFEDGDTEGLPQSAGTDYWFISRSIYAGTGEDVTMPSQLEVARDSCWYVHCFDHVQAYRALGCLMYLQERGADARFGPFVARFISQTRAYLSEVNEVYRVPALRWEQVLLESLQL